MSINKESIKNLVDQYDKNRKQLVSSSSDYSESDTRAEYIDPFLKALGWDIYNKKGKPNRLKEVKRETRVNVDEKIKFPDYELRSGFIRKIFVEAKKPSVDLVNDPSPAFQVRRYGWSGNLKISVLTNFETLILYDTTAKPDIEDNPSHSRIKVYNYKDYLDKIDEISSFLSRESIYSNEFEKFVEKSVEDRDLETVDSLFLDQLNQWRVLLSESILDFDSSLSSESLNNLSQRFLLRILFLRMCEDRGIETYENLKEIASKESWSDFSNLLIKSDKKYDSGLFNTDDDPLTETGDLMLSTDVVKEIIESLYYPESPYQFSVFKPEFLGEVYEKFLKQKVKKEDSGVVLKAKPEEKDSSIVATPSPIIDIIVENTISDSLDNLTFEEIKKKKILDPACGSGGFLISSFELLLDKAITSCRNSESSNFIYEVEDGFRLKFEKKVELLNSCIFGADNDFSATEVSKFSLLVKLLESESAESLPSKEPLLPSLVENIKYGDSLISSNESNGLVEKMKSIPLDWGDDLPSNYDFIIGNPPFLKTEDIKNIEPAEFKIYKDYYKTTFRQFDKYYLFLEKAIKELLDDQGKMGMILSRKFANVKSGKKLRKLIHKKTQINKIVDFGSNQLFNDKTTYTLLLYLQKSDGEKNNIKYGLVSDIEKWLETGGDLETVSLPYNLLSGDDSWLLPNSKNELDLVNAMTNNSLLLGDLFDIFNGIQTSRDSVYVIKEGEEDGNFIKFTKDNKDWKIEKDILKPFFVDSLSQLKSFYPISKTAYVIFPYNIIDGSDGMRAKLMPYDELKNNYPYAWKWLKYNKEDLIKRSISPKPKTKNEWYKYGRSQALTSFEDRKKIIVGVNSRGDKYVFDDSNVLLASGGTAGECAISYFRNEDKKSEYDLNFILGLLNSKAVEYYCRKKGSPFRGGWYARGTSILEKIPIPKIIFSTENKNKRIHDEVVKEVINLRNLCSKSLNLFGAKKEEVKKQISIKKEKIESLIHDLYGVSELINNIKLPD